MQPGGSSTRLHGGATVSSRLCLGLSLTILSCVVRAGSSNGGVFSIAPMWDSLPVPVTPLLVRPTAIKPGCFYEILFYFPLAGTGMICSVVLPRKFKDVERDEKKIVTGSLVDLSGTKNTLYIIFVLNTVVHSRVISGGPTLPSKLY